MERMMRLTATLLVTAAVGCGGGDGQWAGSVRDSAGVAIVLNSDEGVWEGEGWVVEEELRIGALEGEPEYQFGQIGWVTADSRGRIYVLDVQAQNVRVYSSSGEYLQTIGGPGSGPGELGRMQQSGFMLVATGDTLLVPDLANQRVNIFGADGTSLGSFRLSLEDGIPMAFRATPSGVIAKQVRQMALPGQQAIEKPTDAIVLLQADGTVLDTVMTFPSGETLRFGGGVLPEVNIYAPEPVWDLRNDLTLLFGVNDAYRIELWSEGGELERVLTKPFEPIPVTERDRDAIMAFFERTWREIGIPSQIAAQMRQRIHFGEFVPAFANIVAGPENTVWVQHYRSAAGLDEGQLETFDPTQDTGAPEWDVFDAEGRYLGVVSMPNRFVPRVIRDGRIYGVWRDELGVQYVLRLRIVDRTEEDVTT